MKRARFVAGSGLVIGFTIAGSSRYFAAAAPEVSVPQKNEATPLGANIPTDIDSWLSVGADGRIRVKYGKVELGTGIETSLMQIVADELDVPVSHVHVIAGDTESCPDQGYTAGSASLKSGAVPIRQAAAEARNVLIGLAATNLSIPAERLATRDGAVYVTDTPSRRVAYGTLIGGRSFEKKFSDATKLKAAARYTVVGTSVARVDIPKKVDGTFAYVQNLRVPGMLHGRVVRPAKPGAHLAHVDEASIHDVPGARVVRKANFLAVVAPNEWDAIRAASSLKATWDGGGIAEATNLGETVRNASTTSEKAIVDRGAVDSAGTPAVTATYVWPFQSHGSIGPSCAVADVKNGKATVWSATQGVYALRGAIAQLLDMPGKSVRVIYTEGAGCYGHNGADDVAADAALLSAAVGRPVRVQWMRHDETAWDPKGPAVTIDMAGTVADGAISMWKADFYTPTHAQRPGGEAGNLLAGQLTDAPAAKLLFIGGDRDAPVNYAIPNYRVTMHNKSSAVIRQSSLRGLGGTQNSFANESFMDELAVAAKADPLEFRRKHLAKDAAALDVLNAVAKLAKWEPRTRRAAASEPHARGRGIAYVQYENTEALVAAVADVIVDRSTGHVRVERVYVAHDCGLIVNPDGVRNQVEGNIIQGASRALKERVTFDRSRVTSVDWKTYPIFRFSEIPDVQIALIDRRDQPVKGAGEASTTVAAPAIANAIYDAVGVRLREVPFTPDRILAAMRAAKT